jgi:hypothetical protein
MRFQRLALLAVCMVMALAVLLTACPAPAQDVELILYGFRAWTAQQFRTDAVAEAIRLEYPDWKVTSLAAGGEAQVISKRISGETDFFLTPYLRRLEVEVQTPLHPEIDIEQATAYSLMVPTSNSHVYFFAAGRVGLSSIREIVDQKLPLTVGVGPGGSTLLFSKILEYYGTSLEEAEGWGLKRENLIIVMQEGAEALQSGRVDIGISWTQLPSQAYMGVTFDLDILPIDDPGLVQMLKEMGFYEATIPANAYQFISEDVPTVAQLEFLVASPHMPDDIVYDVVKAVFNHKEVLEAAGAGAYLTPEAIAKSTTIGEGMGVPFHPEALRFYRDMGWIE